MNIQRKGKYVLYEVDRHEFLSHMHNFVFKFLGNFYMKSLSSVCFFICIVIIITTLLFILFMLNINLFVGCCCFSTSSFFYKTYTFTPTFIYIFSKEYPKNFSSWWIQSVILFQSVCFSILLKCVILFLNEASRIVHTHIILTE